MSPRAREARRSLHPDLMAASLDAIPSHLVVVDQTGDIVYANEAWRRFGRQNQLPNALLGEGPNYFASCDFEGTDGAYAREAVHGIQEILAGRLDRFTQEYPCHSPEEQRWFILRAARFDLGGAPHAVVVHDDITHRHLAEDSLRAHQAQLMAFNAAVSHDLRGPLRRIETLTQDLADLKPGSDAKETVRLIHQETRRARDYILAMLSIEQVSSARMKMERVDLSVLAIEVAREIEMEDPSHDVEWSIQPGLEAQADPILLRFALTNLLRNAWKFTSQSKAPRIEVGHGFDADGREGFFVRDNGIGFRPDEAARLFRAFSRLPDAAAFKGTGVGLATVARIVERHGGEVWARGEPGEGAAFWFTLPGPGDAPRQDAR